MGRASFNFAVLLFGAFVGAQAPVALQGSVAPTWSYAYQAPYVAQVPQKIVKTSAPVFEIPYAPGVREAMLQKNKTLYQLKTTYGAPAQLKPKKVVKLVKKGTAPVPNHAVFKKTATKVVQQKKGTLPLKKDDRYRQFAVKNKSAFKKAGEFLDFELGWALPPS